MDGAVAGRPLELTAPLRAVLTFLGGLAIVLALVPPVASHVGRYAFVQAVQFALLALVAPALLVVGAPWKALRLARSDRVGPLVPGAGPAIDRLAARRQRADRYVVAFGYLALFLGVVIAWRVPASVDGIATHPLLALAEALTLVPAGVALWLELIGSPPLEPRASRPQRMALAALAMWVLWLLAYLIGFSRSAWFPAYHHVPGHGLSLSADQQITAAVIWFVSLCSFIPVVFVNLVRWLRSEENPDEELRHIVREKRRRGGPA